MTGLFLLILLAMVGIIFWMDHTYSKNLIRLVRTVEVLRRYNYKIRRQAEIERLIRTLNKVKQKKEMGDA